MEPLEFNSRGLFNPRDYELTFDELRASLLVVGPGQFAEPDWDAQWRQHLVNQAEILAKQLWQIGVTDIFFDGSFVEQKAHPNDIDGYFVYDDLMSFVNGDMEHKLNMSENQKGIIKIVR